ncbi:MAG TPA: hypothetical protein VEK05_01910, partial [Burkholderiales bacterium]|nr:hypothetical protein [Burkholderiales bacterium]
SPVVIGLLSDWFQDMGKAFIVVGLMFLVAGVLWLFGARFLARDTENSGRLSDPSPRPSPARGEGR